MSESQEKYERLKTILAACPPLVLAFSGGLDSRFLAFAAKGLLPEGVRIHLYFFQGPQTKKTEVLEARDWAYAQGLPFSILPVNALLIPAVKHNERERCYHCKRAMFTALQKEVLGNPPFPAQEHCICDGSNASDQQAYRPGLRALKKLGIRSPLAEARLGKQDIHKLAARAGMDNPSQQARPCLFTRYAYGLAANEASLAAIDAAETIIHSLLKGAGQAEADFRLRLVSGPAAREQNMPGSGQELPLTDFAAELHINSASLTPELQEELATAVAGQGFARPRIILVNNISGYYDRLPATPAEGR